jgi:hypothetical protein
LNTVTIDILKLIVDGHGAGINFACVITLHEIILSFCQGGGGGVTLVCCTSLTAAAVPSPMMTHACMHDDDDDDDDDDGVKKFKFYQYQQHQRFSPLI